MASYNEVLGVLREYRNNLESQTVDEYESQFMDTGTISAFTAQGGVAAFATPLSNVHATGVGVRVKEGKIVADDFVIKVYVFDKTDFADATPDLLSQYKGVGVDIERLPIQQALAVADHRIRHRPIPSGVSIAPLNEMYVGTLGCFLHRTTNGIRQLFALSNNHVMADTNRLLIGTLIVQPGPEVTPPTASDAFAALSAFIPIQFPDGTLTPVSNNYDAAIALITDEQLIATGQQLGIPDYNPGLGIGVAVPGMRVIKSGRTTGVTTGTVIATRVNGVQINYGTRTAPRITTFNDTIQIVSDEEGKPFSLPGDSGSVILDRDNGQPVALLFAGDGISTTACDLGGVCRQFQAQPL